MRLLLDSHSLIWAVDQLRSWFQRICRSARPQQRPAPERGIDLGNLHQDGLEKANTLAAVPPLDGEGDGGSRRALVAHHG